MIIDKKNIFYSFHALTYSGRITLDEGENRKEVLMKSYFENAYKDRGG